MLEKLNLLKKITDMKSRTGTKAVIINLIVVFIIVIFLNIILPLLGLWFDDVTKILPSLDVSKTTLGLLGQGAVAYSINEIRKAIENKK